MSLMRRINLLIFKNYFIFLIPEKLSHLFDIQVKFIKNKIN